MRFHIIENEQYRHLSWIGNYTYGTCMIRGISINLFSQYGKICEEEPDKILDEPDKLTYILNDNDVTNFRNDFNAFRMDDFS